MKKKLDAVKESARRVSKYLFMFGILLLVFLVDQPVFAKTFVKGDVFAAINDGLVKHYSADGTFIETLNTGCSGYTTGMAFDSGGNLYVTCFSASKVVVFDNNGSFKGAFGTGYNIPESIAFDRSGNAYVGNLNNGIRQYDQYGNFLKTISSKRTDWLDVTSDNKTIYYTQESSNIYTVDIATNKPGPNFTTGTASHAFALRILPDGGVLLADGYNVKRYDNTGKVIQTYSLANENTWFSLNRDPDGTSVWSGNYGTGKAYKFDIATGRLLQMIDTKSGYHSLYGLIVYGELTAAKLAATNLRVVDTISTVNNDLDTTSFSKKPISITNSASHTVVEWKYDSFSIGQTEDITFNVLLKSPQPNENRLVNHNFQLFYTDIYGNPVKTELGPQYVYVLQSAFDSSIATDKPVYQANEDVVISSGITNLSEYTRTADAKILIEDNKGALVKEVTTLPNLNFAAGETKNFNNIIFNTGTILAGDYKAHLILYDGQQQVVEASVSFTLQPTITLTSKVTTDKIAYNPNENVTISSAIQSTSPNYIFSNLDAKIIITDTQGQAIFTDSKNIPILTPGQLTDFKTYWNVSTNPKGIYTVTLEVFAGATVLSSSTTTFEILGSSNTGSGLAGTLAVSPNPVYQGRDETVTYTITNKGNEDISNLKVKVLIVNPDTQEIKNTFENTIDLSMNTTVTGDFVSSTSNLTSGVYLVILQTWTSAVPEGKTLSDTTFEVKPSLEVTKTNPDVKNILVWLNYSWQSGQNCPDRTLIEQALNEAGVSYHIVFDKKDFEAELGNPFYTDFLVLGDHGPIEDHFSEELREQVYSGKGLLSSMFNRQDLDGDVLGIKFNGNLSGSNYPVELLESEMASQGSFQSYGRALKVESIIPDESIGWILETTKKGTAKYPGIIRRQYGDGKVLFYAFDLGLSSGNYSQFADLLKNSLTYIHKSMDTTAFHPNQLVPVEIKIRSLGGAFDLRITETYPADLKLYDPLAGIWITDDPWTINTHLESDETKTSLYYVLLPDKSGTFTLKTEIGYMENELYNFYQDLSTEIVVDKIP